MEADDTPCPCRTYPRLAGASAWLARARLARVSARLAGASAQLARRSAGLIHTSAGLARSREWICGLHPDSAEAHG
eukprot:6198038-Pleurochrysis_carterae.AAC.2